MEYFIRDWRYTCCVFCVVLCFSLLETLRVKKFFYDDILMFRCFDGSPGVGGVGRRFFRGGLSAKTSVENETGLGRTGGVGTSGR